MWQSLRISHMILRISLATVFLWFGIDKFFHPAYWISAWMPNFLINFGTAFHISINSFVYSIGVVELLVGISLASNMFINFFAPIAAMFLIITSLSYGFNEILVGNLGIIGGLLALVFWPNPGVRRYS